jgi:hypothetical protein
MISFLKKTTALLAIAGMMASPLAMAQQAQQPAEPAGNASVSTAPPTGPMAGLSQATGLSQTALGVAAAAAAVGVGIAVSQTTGTTGTN